MVTKEEEQIERFLQEIITDKTSFQSPTSSDSSRIGISYREKENKYYRTKRIPSHIHPLNDMELFLPSSRSFSHVVFTNNEQFTDLILFRSLKNACDRESSTFALVDPPFSLFLSTRDRSPGLEIRFCRI